MKNKRTKRFLFLISLLIFPIFLLGFLSFKSIRNSAIVIETQYYEQLDQVFYGITEETQKMNEELINNLNILTVKKLQLGTTLTRLSRSVVKNDFPGLESVVVWDKNGKIYPRLNPTRDSSDNLLNNGDLPLFEQKLIPIQHRTDLKKKHLQLRVKRSYNKKLSEKSQVLNELGIIKLLYQTKSYAQCIKRIKRYHKNFQHSTLYIDLLELKSYTKLGHFSKAYQIGYQSFSNIFEKHQLVDLSQAQFVLEEMYAHLLSDQKLKEDERKNLWALNENIKNILIDAKVYYSNYNQIQQLKKQLSKSGANSLSVKKNSTWFLLHKFNFEGQKYIISSTWDLNRLNPWVIKQLNITRPTWKKNSFQLFQAEKLLIDQKFNNSNVVYKETPFTQDSPFDGLKLYKPQESEIQNMIHTRSGFLYGLLFVSFILIIIGATFVLRAIKKEQKLLGMKSNFLSSITHELKTPLTSIKMFAEMMQTGRIKTLEKTQEYGSLIHKETHRLQLMVDDILNYSQIDQGVIKVNLVEHNLMNTLNNIIIRVSPIAMTKNIHFELQHPGSAIIKADPQYLESLLQNIIDNAIKYSPRETKVQVIVSEIDLYYEVKIIDQGIGIAKKEQPYIFDLFYRVGDEMTRKTKGSGLGLAIAQSIAKLHNTQITLESELSKGSTFRVKFKKVPNA